jgi:hypothetical protein
MVHPSPGKRVLLLTPNFLAGIQTQNTAIGTKTADLENLGVYFLFWN